MSYQCIFTLSDLAVANSQSFTFGRSANLGNVLQILAEQLELTVPVDIDVLLASKHHIAITWCAADIREIRPDLSAEQAWEVLAAAREDHDATIGINWDVLANAAEQLFGSPPADTPTDGGQS